MKTRNINVLRSIRPPAHPYLTTGYDRDRIGHGPLSSPAHSVWGRMRLRVRGTTRIEHNMAPCHERIRNDERCIALRGMVQRSHEFRSIQIQPHFASRRVERSAESVINTSAMITPPLLVQGLARRALKRLSLSPGPAAFFYCRPRGPTDGDTGDHTQRGSFDWPRMTNSASPPAASVPGWPPPTNRR